MLRIRIYAPWRFDAMENLALDEIIEEFGRPPHFPSSLTAGATAALKLLGGLRP